MNKSIAKQYFENSGLYEMDHGTNKFNKNDFIDYFSDNYNDESELVTAFISYLANTNHTSIEEIEHQYSL